MSGIYELVLKTPDGQERKTLAFLPTEFVRHDIQEKAARCGMKATLNLLTGPLPAPPLGECPDRGLANR